MSLSALYCDVYPQFHKLNMSEWLWPRKSIFKQINISMPVVQLFLRLMYALAYKWKTVNVSF